MILSFPSPSRFNTLIPWDLLLAIICAVSFHSIVLQEKVPPAFSVRKLLLSLGTRKKVSKGLSVQRTKCANSVAFRFMLLEHFVQVKSLLETWHKQNR